MNPIVMLMTFASFFLVMGVRYGAQAAMARLLGDGSLARQGRLSLNPARHVEALGTCVALLFSFPISGAAAGLGWGRPIQPDAMRLRTGANAGVAIVALTGIVVNLLLGVGLAVTLGLVHPTLGANLCANGLLGGPLQGCLAGWQPGWLLRIEQFGFVFASVNLVVGLLNIIPLFPLDGYFLLFTALPNDSAVRYRNSQGRQQIILTAVLLVLPLLLSFLRLPAYLAPGTLVNGLANVLMGIFTHFTPFAQQL